MQPLLPWNKNKCYIFWVCVSSVRCPAFPALQHLSTLSQKRQDFRKKKLMNAKCMFWFSLQVSSETFLILRRTEWDVIKMYIGLHVKYSLFLSDFNETWILSTDFRKTLNYQISWKSAQWQPSCSMRTDGHVLASPRYSQFRKRS
jgi:hypothetical protein